MKKFTAGSRARYDWVWRIEKTWEMFVDQREGDSHEIDVITSSLDRLAIEGQMPLEMITDFIDATIAAELEGLNRTMTALRDALAPLISREVSWNEMYQSQHPSADKNREGVYPAEGTVSAIRVGALYPELTISAQIDIKHRDQPAAGFVIPHMFDWMFDIDVR